MPTHSQDNWRKWAHSNIILFVGNTSVYPYVFKGELTLMRSQCGFDRTNKGPEVGCKSNFIMGNMTVRAYFSIGIRFTELKV